MEAFERGWRPQLFNETQKLLIVTSTDIQAPLVLPLTLLTGLALEAETRVVDWKTFVSLLIDPTVVPMAETVVWIILLQVEDWDHFLAHAQNPAIAPSFDLIERKFKEITNVLDGVGTRQVGRIIVGILPPPEEVAMNSKLMKFRNGMCAELENSLSIHPSIRVCQVPQQLATDRTAHEWTETEEQTRFVYRIPIRSHDNTK